MTTDYYAVLGVPRHAGTAEVRRRFRELARQRHPDRFRGEEKARAEREFQALTEAFNVLADAERRRLHDRELSGDRPAPGGGGGIDPREVARAYLGRGVRAYREKRYAEAAESFEQATRATPEDARAWYYLALAASHGKRRDATGAIERACKLEPMNVPYLRAAGRILAGAGDLEAAEHYYNEALKWSAEDPAIRQELEALRSGSRKGRFGFFGRT